MKLERSERIDARGFQTAQDNVKGGCSRIFWIFFAIVFVPTLYLIITRGMLGWNGLPW